MEENMKKYNITVNGNLYEVTVEEADASATTPAAPVAPAAPKAAPAPAPKAAKPAAPAGKAGANVIKAPMPGNIIKVNFKAGDSIKRGDVICVLEAMKMENDICALADGVLATVDVAQGATVNTDAVIATMN